MGFKKISFTFVILFLLSGCIELVAVSTIGTGYLLARDKTVAQSMTDGKILADISGRLMIQNLHGKYSRVNVNIYDGRVLLTGYVKGKGVVKQVMATSWKVKGVKEVINEMSTDVEEKRRNIPLDNIIASRLKTKLIVDHDIESLDINIDVYDRVVFLLGKVRNDQENRQVTEIASQIKGVKKVISHLQTDA